MANLQPVTKSGFTNKSWKRCSDYLHSSQDSVCPLGLTELPVAMMSMPIAFCTVNEQYSILAVQGLQPGVNALVNADGEWQGGYIPANYRRYPFALAKNELQEEELVLCIDTDSSLLVDGNTEEPFLDKNFELSQPVKEITDFIRTVNAAQEASTRTCKILADYGLLKPWKFFFKKGNDLIDIEGLSCVDETALSELSSDAYAELRIAGVIPIIYCQLFSMQKISHIGKLTQDKNKDLMLSKGIEIDLSGLEDEGNISFENI